MKGRRASLRTVSGPHSGRVLGRGRGVHMFGEVFRAPQLTVSDYGVWCTVIAFPFVPVHLGYSLPPS